jgi:FecR protein
MNEEYLWNRAGQPDAEITELEQLLAPLGYRTNVEILQGVARKKPLLRHSRSWLWAGAAAAAMLVAGIGLSFRHRVPYMPRDSAWKLSWNGATPGTARIGQTIETGRSAARLESAFIGEVRVDPSSRLRILQDTKDAQRLSLDHGTIHAFIWAPPRQFVVDTPAATAIDLGCKYTLHVAHDGTGSLHVEMGWVAFQWQNLESFIPAGASCTTRPGRGPGTPHFSDASADLESALNRFDESGDRKALGVVLAEARSRDALTLWHLLSRTQGTERAEVFTRFSQFVQLPPSVTKQKILNGDGAAIDAAWNALNLGNTDWWREWKRRW